MRPVASVSLLLAGSLAGIVSIAGCSAKHDPPPGEILLAIDTNLKVPDDIDQVGISVTTSSGVVSEDRSWLVAPIGEARFPATLALVRGTDEPIDIRAVGYKAGVALALREVVTTIPADRTALLHVELNWLDKGTVSGSSASGVHTLDALGCPAGQTSIAGTCGSFTLDSASLDAYSAAALPSSDDAAACVDVDSCFAGSGSVSYPLPLAAADCSVAVPSFSDGELNVGLRLRPGGDGWCDGSGCTIPLADDATEGWSLVNGRIQLPPAVCANAKVVAVTVTAASAACPAHSTAHPACQEYGGDGGVATGSDGGSPDATMSDAAGADGGPPASGQYSTNAGALLAFAVDAQYVYVLETSSMGAGYATLKTFARAAGFTALPNVGTLDITGNQTSPTYAMSASFPGLAVLATDNVVSGSPSESAINTYDITDPTLVTQPKERAYPGVVSPCFTVAPSLVADHPQVVLANYQATMELRAFDVVSGAESGSTNASCVGYDPASKSYAVYGTSTGGSTYGPLPDAGVDGLANNPTTNFAGGALSFAFPGDSIVAYLTSDGTVRAIRAPGAAGAGAPINVATTTAPVASQAPRVISGIDSSDRLVWIDGTGQLNEVTLAGGSEPLNDAGASVLLDAGTGGLPAQQVVLDGTDLYWTDGTTLWQRDITTLAGVVP